MPPLTIAGPNVFGTTDIGTTLSVTISENGTGYYLVQAAEDAAPNVAAVLAGNSFVMTANSMVNQPITGLAAAKLYKIYFVARDATNHVQASVQSVALNTTVAPDLTPPVTAAGPSISVAATDSTVSVSQTINEAGTGYYLMQAADLTPPTVAAAKAATSFAMSANTPAVVALSGLSASTAYTYFFVAKDAANNDQAAVQSVSVTTTGLPSGYVSQGGLTWTPNTICSASFGGDFNNWVFLGGIPPHPHNLACSHVGL